MFLRRMHSGSLRSDEMMILRIREFVKRHELPFVILLFTSVVLGFFWKQVFLGEVILPSHVLYLFSPWTTVRPPNFNTMPQNDLLSDVTVVFYPWHGFVYENLRRGVLPMWNPYQGCGAPFIGNDQSAVFSPFNVLYYLLPSQTAWNAVQMLTLFIAGFGTYLYVKSIGVGGIGSTASGISFMFCGFLIAWLEGPTSRTACFLPIMFVCAERLAVKKDLTSAAFLGGITGLQFLSGHIETSLFIDFATSLYIIFRMWTTRTRDFRSALRILLLSVLSLFIGLALGAVQILPFLEYVSQSQVITVRHGNEFYAPVKAMIMLVLPNFFGNPVNGTYWANPWIMNYSESVGGYAGFVAMFFALIAATQKFRDRFVLFFTGLALFCLSVVFKLPILFEAVTYLPLFDVAANQRLLLIVAFAISILGGLGVDSVMRRRVNVLVAYAVAFMLLVVLAAGMAGSVLSLSPYEIGRLSAQYVGYVQYIAQDILFLLLLTSVVIALITLRHVGKIPDGVLAGSILLLVLLNSSMFAINYNPSVGAGLATYPETGSIELLQNDNSTFRILPVGWTMPPNTAMNYKLSDIRIYDAIVLKRYRDLMTAAGNFESDFQITQDYSSPLFNLMNVKYVMVGVPPGGPALNLTLDANQDFSDLARGEITTSNSYGQTFLSRHNGLSAVSVLMATFGRRNMYSTVFHLRDSATSSTDIVTVTFNNSDVRDDTWQTFYFSPIPDSANRTFFFYFTSSDAVTGNAVTAWSSSQDIYPDGEIIVNGKPATGDLSFRTFYNTNMHSRFSLVYEGEDAEVWRNNDFLPRAFIVHRVVAMPDDHQALAYIKAEADLDLSRLAIIDEQVPQEILMRLDGAPVQGYSNVTILSYEANRISLQAEVQDEGFLVLSDNWFPGWTVTVDREPNRVYRTDYTFRGVFLTRGDHIVEFTYDPVSLKLGGCLSFIGVATLACIIILEQRRKIHVICARHSWKGWFASWGYKQAKPPSFAHD